MKEDTATVFSVDHAFEKLPNHLLIEIFIRVPISEWAQISCVRKQWAALFRGECLWKTALIRIWPLAGQAKRWPGPIPQGLSRRRYTALYVSKHVFAVDDEIDELVGHAYLFLKEQLELSTMPPPSAILHGTMIGLFKIYLKCTRKLKDGKLTSGTILKYHILSCMLPSIYKDHQFITCGKSRDKAHELASQIWLAVINNLEENERTFLLLKRLTQEGDLFLPYPYSRSYGVQWRVFEKLFTDFRDCFNREDYYDILACAKSKFQPIPSTWLGY